MFTAGPETRQQSSWRAGQRGRDQARRKGSLRVWARTAHKEVRRLMWRRKENQFLGADQRGNEDEAGKELN